jgi:hypothetical protein
MDKYIRDRGLQVELLPPIQGPPIQEAAISSAVEEEISYRADRPPLGPPPLEEDVLVNRELQKLNKQLKKQLSQLVELKKQSNMMAGAFYVCIIAIYLVYLCRSN